MHSKDRPLTWMQRVKKGGSASITEAGTRTLDPQIITLMLYCLGCQGRGWTSDPEENVCCPWTQSSNQTKLVGYQLPTPLLSKEKKDKHNVVKLSLKIESTVFVTMSSDLTCLSNRTISFTKYKNSIRTIMKPTLCNMTELLTQLHCIYLISVATLRLFSPKMYLERISVKLGDRFRNSLINNILFWVRFFMQDCII